MKARLSVVSPGARGREKILEIRNLRKVFQVGGHFLTALEKIDFSVGKGELICILGRSGCGKSTLLKILAGFMAPTAGRVLLEGFPVQKPGPDRGVVFQEDALFPWLTVEENLAFGFRNSRRSRKSAAGEVDRYLTLVGLSEFRHYLPREISGGMKQRVALARVLILQPRVLLMDEPFAALDAQTREEMQQLLLSLWEKLSHTVLFVTHDVTEAVSLADRILLMDKDPGRIRQDIRVDLPRPRQTDSEAFVGFCRRLMEVIRR
ncbi:MAG: ABC transporter ATP-binding protein [Desulfobacterales bacterium]|jgi:NitT/TauT family transport system ATP-binding protein